LLTGSAVLGTHSLLAGCGREPTDPIRGDPATPTAAATRIVSSPPAPLRPVAFVLKIDRGLAYPTALATDGQDNVYVIDGDHHRVQKFDRNGQFLTMWGSIGDGSGQFVFRIRGPIPGGIAVDERGVVYVADYYDRVQAFDDNGRFLFQWGRHGNSAGQVSFSSGLAVDGRGAVYIGDADNHRVQKFDRVGRFLLEWGSAGSGDGEFLALGGVAVDRSGHIVVGDADNSRIQLFDSAGRFLMSWGSPSASGIQPEGPPGVAVDPEGNVYVARDNSDRVEKYDRAGHLLTAWGGTGIGDGRFIYPSGIAVDGEGNVYVTDVIGGRIQKFRAP
jgi:DNA-binding beta-propeller fold protein YncE